MSEQGSQSYLRQTVLSATPEQLQLMLYDGAIRFALQGRDALAAKDWEQVYEKFSRAQKIMLEMHAGLRREINPELVDQMAALYLFVYRKLMDASVQRDVQAVDDALKILRHQRETWVMLMQKLNEARAELAREPAPIGSHVRMLCVEG